MWSLQFLLCLLHHEYLFFLIFKILPSSMVTCWEVLVHIKRESLISASALGSFLLLSVTNSSRRSWLPSLSAVSSLLSSHFHFSQAFPPPAPQTLSLSRSSGISKWSVLLYPLRWHLHWLAGSIFPFSLNIFPNPTGNVSSLFFSHPVSA